MKKGVDEGSLQVMFKGNKIKQTLDIQQVRPSYPSVNTDATGPQQKLNVMS